MWEIWKNVHKFETLFHSDLVISVCQDLVSMHIHVKYECSTIKHKEEEAKNYREKK